MDDVIPKWVYAVLKKYGNCVLPESVIEYYGVWYTEQLLSDIMGYPVEVRIHEINATDEYKTKFERVPIAWKKKS